jgi:hypothetical protein
MNSKKTFIAVATVISLGFASAAFANDIDESASSAKAAREMRGNPLPWWWNSSENGRGDFGYVPSQPKIQHKKR